ncbi:MAG TPA: URC4/urg3 family protein [Ramlibacter sp.]|nr:URC4/urg3 family protein [Ramlibacter sp.]
MKDTDFISPHAQAEDAAAILRTTVAVRDRARQLLSRARQGESPWFIVDDGFLESAAGEVVAATRRRYPKLHVPRHSRWRHFQSGGVDRKAQLDRLLAHLPRPLRGHAMIDLAFVSVLLDAGGGPHWKYVEPATGQTFTRSEGLAVASFHAFVAGLFSSDKDHPLRADAAGLRGLVTDHLASAFQVSEANPLVGIQERAILLRRLGEAMSEQPEAFGEDGRPSGLFDMMISPLGPEVPPTADVTAHDILSEILMTLSGIWPSGNAILTVPLGDCWRHPAVRGEGLSHGWMPFHKLSQWLTYSLIEPFEWSGVIVHELDHLTALPEYRNGGLLIDSGLLRLRDEAAAQEIWQPGDEIVVEWRALTVALMDEVARAVRQQLGLSESQFPLACVLEGGTWAAGRELAQRHRGGLPPLKVVSDGTVF